MPYCEIDAPLGAVVATAFLIDVIPITEKAVTNLERFNPSELAFGDYTIPGRYAWILTNIKKLPEPIPAKGMQRLWEWQPPEGVCL
jgi:hypothetical protein